MKHLSLALAAALASAGKSVPSIFPDVAPTKSKRSRSCYEPHQGAKEMARRRARAGS